MSIINRTLQALEQRQRGQSSPPPPPEKTGFLSRVAPLVAPSRRLILFLAVLLAALTIIALDWLQPPAVVSTIPNDAVVSVAPPPAIASQDPAATSQNPVTTVTPPPQVVSQPAQPSTPPAAIELPATVATEADAVTPPQTTTIATVVATPKFVIAKSKISTTPTINAPPGPASSIFSQARRTEPEPSKQTKHESEDSAQHATQPTQDQDAAPLHAKKTNPSPLPPSNGRESAKLFTAKTAPSNANGLADRSNWLRTQDPHAYTLQLLSSSTGLEELRRFARKHGNIAELGFFRSQRQGHELFSIVYGIYPDKAQAEAAAQRITAQWPDVAKPWIRTIRSIQIQMETSAELEPPSAEPSSVGQDTPRITQPTRSVTIGNTSKLRRESVAKHIADPTNADLPPFTKSIALPYRVDDYYKTALLALRQGRGNEAQEGFEQILRLDPRHHNARLSLANLALEHNDQPRAEQVLREGLQLDTQAAVLAFPLARIMIERGDLHDGIEILRNALPGAGGDPNYYAFIGALEQRTGNHRAAVGQYRMALRYHPGNATWLMGLGISLAAEHHNAEAHQTFRAALNSGDLNTDLRSYVEQQLQALDTASALADAAMAEGPR
ncbi:MSHA biogenesis protein MshN [Gammaproteobacteria bacterium]